SGYHQTPARKVSRNIQLNGLLSPTRDSVCSEAKLQCKVRRDHPLNLSISISGGKETNKDSLIRIVVWRSVLSDGPGPSSLERGPERVRVPSCPGPVAPRGAVYESGCLGMQPQSGGKFRPRLNMGERPIVNKYRESQRVLEIVGREADGGQRCIPVGCGMEQSGPLIDLGRGPTQIKVVT
ncbi:unnamed protein product, partial [Brassica napus]